jgi:hypothetical protein
MDNIERAAIATEGYDPDDPAVVPPWSACARCWANWGGVGVAPATRLRPVIQYRLVAHLTPGQAIEACETALRQLLQLVVPPSVGEDWLAKQLSAEKLTQLEQRREEEEKKHARRGVASTPESLLAYTDLYMLRTLVEKNWQILVPALGKKSETGALLKRLDDLRNAIAHNRPLVPFEADLAAGIAGEMRNRVTIIHEHK